MKLFLLLACVAAATAFEFDKCQTCENILSPILNKATPADRQKVVDILKTLCFGNQACLDKVNSISGDITTATAPELCADVDLCPKTEAKRMFDLCSVCESGVDKIKSHLSDETIQEIKEKLEYLCFGNPTCISKIDAVAEDISNATSQEICEDLHLCKPQLQFYSGGGFCGLCESFVAKYLSKINNQTLAELEQKLDQMCRGNAQCLDAVAKLIGDIADLTPEKVCQAVHLCPTGGIYAEGKCLACKQKLDNILSDANLDKIVQAASKICHNNAACLSEVQKVEAMIKAGRSTYVEDICKVAKQC